MARKLLKNNILNQYLANGTSSFFTSKLAPVHNRQNTNLRQLHRCVKSGEFEAGLVRNFRVNSSGILRTSTDCSQKVGVSTQNLNKYSADSSKPLDVAQLPDRHMKIGEWTVHYAVVGEGEHVVLALPGVLGSLQTDFGPVLSRFNPDKFTVVCWDPPGYGKSKLLSGFRKLTSKSKAEDAETAALLMEKLGFDSYSILGWSAGGITGVHIATSNPTKVKKLCTWGSAAFSDDRSIESAKVMGTMKNWPKDALRQYFDTYGEKVFEEMLADLKDFVITTHRTGSFQIQRLLPLVKAPTLIIHGQDDTQISLAHSEMYKKLIANSKLEIWPSSAHHLHLQHPDKFVKRVEKFFLQP